MNETFYKDIIALQRRNPESSTLHNLETSSLRDPETSALRNPESVVSNATDLPTWVMDHLDLRPGQNALDISSGQEALPMAKLVGYAGHVLSVNRSYETLHALAQRSQELGLEARIRLLQIHLDEMAGHLRKDDFDRALAGKALYTIKKPHAVFQAIHQALKPGGAFFLYGASRNNNIEIKRFHASLYGNITLPESKELTFLEEVGLPNIREHFSQVEIVKFEQPLLFDSPEMLYNCWCSSKLYSEELDIPCHRASVHHFESNNIFETVKRVVGIKAIK